MSVSTNSRSSIESAPAITLVEELRLGSVAGREEELFGNVFDVAVDPSDNIYVLDIGARMVRVFSSVGSPLHTIGQPGEGPGEFAYEPLRLAVSSDTVAILDRFRLHLFSTEGVFLNSTQQSIAGNEPIPLWSRAGASWVAGRSVRTRPTSPADRITRDTLRNWRVDLDAGALTTVIAEVPGSPRWYFEDLGRSHSQFLGPAPAPAARPTGEVYVSAGVSHEVVVFSSEGDLLRIHRSDVAPVSLSRAEVDGMVDRMVAYYDSLGISSLARTYRDAYEALGAPDVRPVLGEVVVADDGSVLVERIDLDPDPFPLSRDDPATWDLLTSEGRIVGRLVLEPGTRVEQLTPHHLYVVERDELGVQYVVRYRIDRPEITSPARSKNPDR